MNRKAIPLLFCILIMPFFVQASLIDTLSGGIQKVLLEGDQVSSRWTGYSGEIDERIQYQEQPLDTYTVRNGDDGDGGSVIPLDIDGQNTETAVMVAIPEASEDFTPDKIENISLIDIEKNGLFDESRFPQFYTDPGYNEISDSPEETFTAEGEIKLFKNITSTVTTNLTSEVPMHVAGYRTNSETYPLFISDISNYPSCYDGSSCSYQFLMPMITEASDLENNYNFYMISKSNPANLQVLINNKTSTKFRYPGRPYKLEVKTEEVFGDKKLDREVRITEKGGNNIFTPSLGSFYNSTAILESETAGGSKEALIVPTDYQTTDDYKFSIEIFNEGTLEYEEELTTAKNVIEYTNEGPEEIGMGSYSSEYKEGVNRLRPIADCLFTSASTNEYYGLNIDGSTQKTLVSGRPYYLNIEDASIDSYSLIEPNSHLVISPARAEEFGNTTHQPENRYEAEQEVLFTPTVPSSNDRNLRAEFYSGGTKDYEVNLSVSDKGTCSDTVDGNSVSGVEKSTEFKERINAVRPILNSMFVAGN